MVYKPSWHHKNSIRDGLTNKIFKHILEKADSLEHHSFESPLKMNRLLLTKLILWNVNLSCCHVTWIRAIDARILQELELSHCQHAGWFLSSMFSEIEDVILQPSTGEREKSRQATEVRTLNDYKLESLKIEHYGVVDEHELQLDVGGLDHCLRSLEERGCKLKHFWLHLQGHCWVPDLELLRGTVSALETLYLNFELSKDHALRLFENNEYMATVLSNLAPNVRQLGFTWNFEAYPPPMPKHTNPITLNIIQLGGPQQNTDRIPRMFTSIMQKVIKEGVSRYGVKKLRLRAIALTRPGLGPAAENTQYYVRSTAQVFQRTEEVMIPTELKELRKHGVEVDILKETPIQFGPAGRL
jgi:hypothetical protein